MEIHKQVINTYLKELHVRDFEQESADITKMYRIDIEANPEDENIYFLSLNFMYGHFGTQIDGVIQATILAQAEDGTADVLKELQEDEIMTAIPLFSKASAIVAKVTEDRGMFPIIMPVEFWFED